MLQIKRAKTIPSPLLDKSVQQYKIELAKFYKQAPVKRQQQKPPYFSNELINAQIIESVFHAFEQKCAYCETPIASARAGNYDHFRPKANARGYEKEFAADHYWWLSFEWENLYLCCQECNLAKSSWFPVDGKRASADEKGKLLAKEKRLLMDPCEDKPWAHIAFDTFGKASGVSKSGQASIDILNLNRPALVERRNEQITAIRASVWSLRAAQPTEESFALTLDFLLSVFTPDSKPDFKGCMQIYCLSLFKEDPSLYHRLFSEPRKGASAQVSHKRILLQQYLHNLNGETRLNTIKHTTIPAAASKNVFIERISIRNFKGIEKLTIEYPKLNHEEIVVAGHRNGESWLILLGENGVGKSSILQAILLTLAGQKYINTLKITASKILKKGKKEGSVKIEFKDGKAPAQLHFSTGSKDIKCSEKEPCGILLGYGSTRLMPDKYFGPEITKNNFVRAKNLFNPHSSLINHKDWLFRLSEKNFNLVALALKDLLLLKRKDLIVRNKARKDIMVAFSGNLGRAISVDEMSDGYKSVFVLVVDIMEKLITQNSSIEVAEGIVLIDEIGTHLHPRWRMKIVGSFRKIFPKVQFIVSTHDPLCLKGSRLGEIVVLNRINANKVISIADLPDPSALRADQLLASEFFGMSSTIDPLVEELFNEYYFILAKPEKSRSADARKRLVELEAALKEKEQMGHSDRDNLMYQAIDKAIVDMRFEPSVLSRKRIKQQIHGKLQQMINKNNRL